jgi:branched-chain amino acid transport system ATP-binding protein
MGKTTIICSIMGLTSVRRGKILFGREEITSLQPYQIAGMGIGWVPQGRRVFPSLTVKETLVMAGRNQGKDRAWSLDRVYSLFPILKERASLRSGLLSGGEQQMLSIARALVTNPELLLMDEPSEGLAPLVVRQIGNTVSELHRSGFSILLVEQNLRLALEVADYVYVISKGVVAYESTPEELRRNEEIKKQHLGVGREVLTD